MEIVENRPTPSSSTLLLGDHDEKHPHRNDARAAWGERKCRLYLRPGYVYNLTSRISPMYSMYRQSHFPRYRSGRVLIPWRTEGLLASLRAWSVESNRFPREKSEKKLHTRTLIFKPTPDESGVGCVFYHWSFSVRIGFAQDWGAEWLLRAVRARPTRPSRRHAERRCGACRLAAFYPIILHISTDLNHVHKEEVRPQKAVC